jgi:Holliday junction resolvase RusA-like endonuclease
VSITWTCARMRMTEDQLTRLLARRGVTGAPNSADTSSPPFALPAEIVLDLPAPISVNRIWRKTKAGVIKSAAYHRWIKRADAMLLDLGQLRGVKPIIGQFTALIVVKRSNIDLDNNAKSVLDFLQSRNFIVNDKLCEELTLRWGDAPAGCRVTISPCKTVNDVLRVAAERLEARK